MSKKHVPIRKAAEYLGVSVDTLRRWDKKGKITSTRDERNIRHFLTSDLKQLKHNSPMSISEAAGEMQMSASKLRRLENKGLIKPQRNKLGHRVYSQADLDELRKNLERSKHTYAEQTTAKETTEPDSHGISDGAGSSTTSAPDQGIAHAMGERFKSLAHNKKAYVLLAAMSFVVTGLLLALVMLSTQSLQQEREELSYGLSGAVMGTSTDASASDTYADNTEDVGIVRGTMNTIARTFGSVGGFFNNDEQPEVAQYREGGDVLAAESPLDEDAITFNLLGIFRKGLRIGDEVEIVGGASFLGPLDFNDQDIDLGPGQIIASNLLYGLNPGDGIEVTSTQTPTITNTGVLSLGGETGELSLEAGTGISVDGLKITNTSPNSDQDVFKTFKLGSSSVDAGSTSDTFEFVAGTGVGLSLNTDDKKLTITGTLDPGITDDGTVVRLSTATDSVGFGTVSPGGKLDVLSTTEQLRLSYDASNYSSFTVDSSGNLTIAPSGGTTNVTGALNASGATALNGNVTLGDASSDDIATNGRFTESIIPKIDLNIDLGSSDLRYNNLYVNNINANSAVSTLGQATFTYEPEDTTYTESSVLINPTEALSDSYLLGIGVGGFERAGIDAEGDIVLGYNDAVTAPSSDDPLRIFGHNGTEVVAVDTSGNLTISGSLTSGASSFSSNITMADDTWIGLGASGGRLEFDDQGTDELNFLDSIIGIGTSTPGAALDVGGGSYTLADGTGDVGISADLEVDNNVRVDGTTLTTSQAFNWDLASSTTALTFETDLLGLDTTNDGVDITSAATTTDVFDITADSLTTGKGLDLSIDGLTTGTGFYAESTSTSLTTGDLASLYWNPGSSTTASSGSSILTLNIGANGTIDKILEVQDNGSSVFSVSQTGITSALPHSFTAAGDVSLAYDLVFTNQTSANIKSYGPLALEAGETWESNNLTLTTHNSGNLVLDLAGGASFSQAQAWDLADSETSALNIESGLLNLDSSNSRVGIGTTGPNDTLEVLSTSDAQLRLAYDGSNYHASQVASDGGLTWSALGTDADVNFDFSGATDGDFSVNSTDLFVDTSANSVGIGATGPEAELDIDSGALLLSNTGNNSVPALGTSLINGEIHAASSGLAFDSGVLRLSAGGGTTSSVKAAIDILRTTGGDSEVRFYTSGEEQARIDTSGYLGINENSPDYFLDVVSDDTTGVLQLTGDSVTTGTGIDISLDGLTTGTGLNLVSTSTALSSGTLASLDWSPGSATTATGDLLSLNIGSNGTIGNILNVQDNGSSVFSVDQAQITSALPHAFTSSGDVSIAYDLNFTNQTASYIDSNAPLYIRAGENFESNDLTLKTYNSGDLVFDLGGGASFSQAQAWDLADSETSSLNIESGLLNLDTSNTRVGINNTSPSTTLDVTGAGTFSTDLAVNGGDLTSSASTFNLVNATPTTVNIAGAGTTVEIGASTGTTSINNALTVDGNTTLGDASGDTVTANADAWTFANATNFDLATSTTALTFETDLLGLDTSNDGVDITTAATTTDAVDITADSLTTGNGIDLSADALTSGYAATITSTSTALTTGRLLSLDWSPGSATTATGDLFRLNIGSNGTVDNILNITDAGSTLFSVSEAQITSALPHSFTAAGDVSIAYDLNLINQTSSNIVSNGPLSITSGEAFESNNLTLKTYNSADLVLDLAGGATLNQAQAWDLADSSTTALNVESGLLNLDTTNTRVGINTTSPSDTLHVDGQGFFTSGVHIGADADANLFDDASNGAGTTTMYIGNESINTTASDERLKENIESSQIDALAILEQLEVVDFDWKEGNPRRERGRFTGLIAQDVYGVLPQVVDKPSDPINTWSVEYHHIVPYLVEGVKELSAQVAALPTEAEFNKMDEQVTTLTENNDSLNQRILTLEEMLGVEASGEAELADSSGDVEDSTASGEATIEDSSAVLAEADDLLASNEGEFDSLIVSGESNLNDISVTGNAEFGLLAINGLFSPDDAEDDADALGASIDVVGPLYLQNGTAASVIDIFGGKIVMTPDGDIEVAGNVTVDGDVDVAGDVLAAGNVAAQKLHISQDETIATDEAEITTDSIGDGVLPAGKYTVLVETEAITDNSRIFITEHTLTSYPLVVTEKIPGESFTVEIARVQTEDIAFDWWIVN